MKTASYTVVFFAALSTGPSLGTGKAQQKPQESVAPQKAPVTKEKVEPVPSGAVPNPGSTPSLSIPMPEIAARSEELNRTLREIAAALPTKDQLSETEAAAQARGALLQEHRDEADDLLKNLPSTLELRQERSWWKSRQSETAEWKGQTGAWAKAAQAAVNQLEVLEREWSATLAEIQNEPEFTPILQLLNDNLKMIRLQRAQALEQLRLTVQLQLASTQQDQTIADVMARLNAELAAQKRMVSRDSLPLWHFSAGRVLGDNVNWSVDRGAGIGGFVEENLGAHAIMGVLFILGLLASYSVQRAIFRRSNAARESEPAFLLLRHWVALAFVPPLTYWCLLLPQAPARSIAVGVLVSLFPILRLMPLLAPRLKAPLYCAAGLYALAILTSAFAPSPELRRGMTFMVSCLAIVTLGYLLRGRRKSGEWSLHPLATRSMILVVVVLTCSAMANLFGYMKLSQFLVLACTHSTFIAIGLYVAVSVFTALLTAGLNASEMQRVSFIRNHRVSFLRWMPKAMQVGAFLIWLVVTLDLLGLWDQSVARAKEFLRLPIGGSSLDVTVGAILDSIAILAVGFLVARAARILLREDVLSRFRLKRGLPELISSATFYVLLMLVFFLAVSTAGIALNKLTLFTGALGVGVGFGLQNIINNFSSGLILQFERPIQLNDILELDGQVGRVTHIGMRASTLKTPQGADVVIPNSMFVAGKVINWTLTEPRRRAELQVRAAYGTDPQTVIDELTKAAASREQVLTDPAPCAFFMNFGENSLEFELQFWVMQSSNWIKVKSDVALAVVTRFASAEIEIPFPQRILHFPNEQPNEQAESPDATPADTPVRAAAKGAGSQEARG